MAKTGMTFDTRDFDLKFRRTVDKTIPEAAADKAFRVAGMVIRDAIMEQPRAPHKTGNLWRSQKIEPPKMLHGEIAIELGFDAKYAAAVHEMPSNVNWTMAGSGPKFLESKLIRNKEKYMAEIAEGIRKKGGG